MANRNSILWSREDERLRLLAQSKRILADIEEHFACLAEWNSLRPEAYINPDPTGEMAEWQGRMKADIVKFENDIPVV